MSSFELLDDSFLFFASSVSEEGIPSVYLDKQKHILFVQEFRAVTGQRKV